MYFNFKFAFIIAEVHNNTNLDNKSQFACIQDVINYSGVMSYKIFIFQVYWKWLFIMKLEYILFVYYIWYLHGKSPYQVISCKLRLLHSYHAQHLSNRLVKITWSPKQQWKTKCHWLSQANFRSLLQNHNILYTFAVTAARNKKQKTYITRKT